MEKDIENVRQARSSFNRILSNSIYADIIKDDAHLDILLNLLKGNNYKSILDIGTGTGYLAFPLAKNHPTAQVRGIDIAEKVIEQNVERAKEQNYVNLSFHSFDGIEYPFAKSDEYNKAFENHSENEKLLYKIEMDSGIVWVKHIEVGNTIYVKP